MGTDTNRPLDIQRINALADGELSPTERAELVAKIAGDRDLARAHATISRLKACIAERVEVAQDAPTIIRRRHSLRLSLALGAGIAFVAGFAALLVAVDIVPDRKLVPIPAREAVITLAALPTKPVIPDLGVAGLVLTDIDVDRSGAVRFLMATYSGPHGCRLDLRVGPAGAAAAPMEGTNRQAWTVGDLAYELTAHGMPGWRFTLIADAAERETRSGGLLDGSDRRLREARSAAPPCTG